MIRALELRRNIDIVKQGIASLRNDVEVLLIAVSKTKPLTDISILRDLGHLDFGENYVQELVEKAETLPKDIRWHFIGALQSNKFEDLSNLESVQTISSEKHATALNQARRTTGFGPLGVWIQVNTSGEETKSGCGPENCVELASFISKNCEALKLKGLMTIGSPWNAEETAINPDFKLLKQCQIRIKEELGSPDLGLSMGMSEDYLSAIQQGSTCVRVGSKIFGERNYNN